jgi:predicted PurR-regulated permease PerM
MPAPESVPDPRHAFLRRVTLVLLLAMGVLLLAALLVLGIGVVLAAFGGILLAVLLNAGARLVEGNTPLSYIASYAVVLVLILALMAGGGVLLAPQIIAQADELARILPELIADLEAWLDQFGWGQWLLERAEDGSAAGFAGVGGGIASGLSDALSYVLVALFTGLFAAASPALYTEGAVAQLPLRHRDRAREILDVLGHTLRRWLVGQAITMTIIGVSTMLVLWAFDVPLAIVLGLIVGLLGFIPYLGPIFGAVPVALIAATQGAETLLWVMLAYSAVQLLEGYVAVPIIHSKAVYVPPAFTIVFQILLGAVIGIMGIVLATPLAAVLLVLSRFYRRDVLGDAQAGELIANG